MTTTNTKHTTWNMIAVAAVAALALTAPDAAFAKTVKIGGTHSREEIAGACKAVGGVAVNTLGTSGGYGCENLDKGTSVNCDAKGNCTGWVPGRIMPGTTKPYNAEVANGAQILQ